MQSLCVLLWKNLMVTKRKPIGFIYQLLLPLLLMSLMYLIKHKLKPKPLRLDDGTMIKFTEEKFPELTSSLPRCLLYTPNSDLAGTLMDEVGHQLGLSILTSVPRAGEKAFEPCHGYYPFTNYFDVANLVSKFHTNEAIIEFEDMEAETWSSRRQDSLTYTIRMNRNFSTHVITSQDLDSIPQDHPDYGDIYEGFTRIQWAIDTSYIKIRSGTTVPQKLSLQEFPYHRRSSEQAVMAMVTGILLYTCCWTGLWNLFDHALSTMMIARATGIQELIKLNGVSIFTLGASYFISCLPPALVFAVGSTVLLKAGDPSLIEHTGGVFLLIGLTLYAVSVIACGMACSYLAHTSQYASVISIFTYLATILLARVLDGQTSSLALVMATGLALHLPLNWMLMEIVSFEAIGKPLTLSEISTSHSTTRGSVLMAYICLSLQSLLYLILVWYLSHVRQGDFGYSEPWNFCCKKEFENSEKINMSEKDHESERDERYFEKPPRNMDVGIRVVNVSKIYPKHKALDDVSLDVYRGEITVLLGHNGAGKTTLMSIISGMLPATKGLVYLNGVDNRSHRLNVRKELGLCPQHNLFIQNLNVLEHVMFFHMLKTQSSLKEARSKAIALLDQLGIGNKLFFSPEMLSGGMKRRLQLASALTGGSDVLVLDEPTSGLDVETRRELWNLLLSLRGGHTVLLSTHFMEEADALGDRVVALHTGQLKCHATPMFLKRAMGIGYRLSITTAGIPNESQITHVIRKHVSNATVKEKTSKSITYNLPTAATSKFPALFAALEKDTQKRKCCVLPPKVKGGVLGIDTIGLGVTTLEEAFLKLCSNTEMVEEDEMDCTDKATTRDLVSGTPLYKRQAMALLMRHVNFMKVNWLMFLIFNFIFPWVLMNRLLGSMTNNSEDKKLQSAEPDLLVDLSMYHSLPERRVLLNMNTTEKVSRRLMDKYGDVRFSDSDNIKGDLIEVGRRNIINYNKYLIGVELDDKHAKALYTTVHRHAAPVAVNMLSNVIASHYLTPPEGGDRWITVHNHPLSRVVQLAQAQPASSAQVKDGMLCCFWAIIVCVTIQFTSCNYQALPSSDGATGVRHLHVMAGCPAALHWLCSLAFHTAVVTVGMVPMVLICAFYVDTDDTLGQPALLINLTVIIIIGSVALFSLLYVLSLCFAERTAMLLATILVLGFGCFVPLIQVGADVFDEKLNFFVNALVWISNLLMPPQTMTVAASKAVYVGRLNALCKVNKDNCPDIVVEVTPGFDKNKCCAGGTVSYFAFDQFSPGKEILIMIGQGIVYMVLVIKLQKGYFNYLYDRVRNAKFVRDVSSSPDEFVMDEIDYVASEIKLSKSEIIDDQKAILVSDLHKNFPGLLTRKRVYAVRGISFSVQRGECFGLLGTNGAGKSTTFKMITTEICPTKGTIFAYQYFLHEDKYAYLRTIGYCPQFYGIDEFQTGSENLRTLLTIHGLKDEEIDNEVKTWIDVVGLSQYENTVALEYSGGYKRRLAAASALCSGPTLSLLDEPTAGVDVGARRRLHSALRKSLCQKRSIVITSHSMDEMETLCARIAIMVDGKIRALGTPSELRSKYAQGYAVIFKIRHYYTDSESSIDDKAEHLKKTMEQYFDCQLKDEHMTMLHYHINDKMSYSQLFINLELIRNSYYKLIEDYSVSETTLEEVFLHLAKEDRGDDQATEEDEVKAECGILKCIGNKDRAAFDEVVDKKMDALVEKMQRSQRTVCCFLYKTAGFLHFDERLMI